MTARHVVVGQPQTFVRMSIAGELRDVPVPQWSYDHDHVEKDVAVAALRGMPADVRVPIHLGVGVVMPTSLITELLMRDDLVAFRDRQDQALLTGTSNAPAASLDSGAFVADLATATRPEPPTS